jgi:alkylated DNA nucleotide flippase Atl1
MIPSILKYTSKLEAAGPGSFHVLDEAKAKRMNAKTLYIPSVEDVVNAIRAIPKGTVVASEDVRRSIAAAHGADSCCPGKFKSYWQWSAFAMEYENGPELPWWRMTKAGGAYAQMPGGATGHAERMANDKE